MRSVLAAAMIFVGLQAAYDIGRHEGHREVITYLKAAIAASNSLAENQTGKR